MGISGTGSRSCLENKCIKSRKVKEIKLKVKKALYGLVVFSDDFYNRAVVGFFQEHEN